jgi:hypothetical protein
LDCPLYHPIHYPLVDGRMFMRRYDGIYCYDFEPLLLEKIVEINANRELARCADRSV